MMIGLPLNTGLGKELGKKGTSSDVTLYNRRSGEKVLNVVEASSYPEKITSMLLSVSLSEFLVFHVRLDGLDKNFAEAVLAADALEKKEGTVFLDGVVEEQVKPLVSGTVVERYEFFSGSPADLLARLLSLESSRSSAGPARVLVDHSFQVRGVGTVVLGVVLSGEVKKYDSLTAHPLEKEVTVKSIQVMDEDLDSARAGDRVGLALKGVTPEEVSRGTVIGDAETVAELSAAIEYNRYSQDTALERSMLFAGASKTEFRAGGERLLLGKKIPVWKGQNMVVYDQSKRPTVRGRLRVPG